MSSRQQQNSLKFDLSITTDVHYCEEQDPTGPAFDTYHTHHVGSHVSGRLVGWMDALDSVVPLGPGGHAHSGGRVFAHGVEGGDNRRRGVRSARGGTSIDGHEGVQPSVFVEHAAIACVDGSGGDGDGAVRENVNERVRKCIDEYIHRAYR